MKWGASSIVELRWSNLRCRMTKRGNSNFSEHWTEHDPRVLDVLRELFGEIERVEFHGGADYRAGNRTIEIKSCREFVKSNTNKIGHRSGGFIFRGCEDADFFLFVVCKETGLDFRLWTKESLNGKLGKPFRLNWRKVFDDKFSV